MSLDAHSFHGSPRREVEEILDSLLGAHSTLAAVGSWAPKIDALEKEQPELARSVRGWVRRICETGELLRASGSSLRIEPGERFGEYRILECIGHGGMGSVYLAVQEALSRRVALKVIREDRLQDTTLRERFRRKALAIADLRHPGICVVHDVGEVEGRPYLAMQFVEGESLGERIRRLRSERPRSGSGEGDQSSSSGPRTLREQRSVYELLAKVARAVHFAHERGVVHRDLKPGNILLDAGGDPVVLDFGLATAKQWESETQLTVSGSPIGTPGYMPPELVRAHRRHREGTEAQRRRHTQAPEPRPSPPDAGIRTARLPHRRIVDPASSEKPQFARVFGCRSRSPCFRTPNASSSGT